MGSGEKPSRFVPQLLAHRRLRETSILDSVREGVETIRSLSKALSGS